MKKIIAAAVLVALALTGCAQQAEQNGSSTTPTVSGGWIGATNVNLPNGGTVVCVYYSSALSCDWENQTGGNQ